MSRARELLIGWHGKSHALTSRETANVLDTETETSDGVGATATGAEESGQAPCPRSPLRLVAQNISRESQSDTVRTSKSVSQLSLHSTIVGI